MSAVQQVINKITGHSSLPKAPLGKNGPEVPRLALGLMGLSAFYGDPLPDEKRLKFLDAAYELGEVFWDSADMYGDNEDLLGKWFKINPTKRKDIFLATKFANKRLPDGSRAVDSTPEYARQACEKSLERLGIDKIDLYYVHRLDLKTPIEKTMHELVKLKNEGKIEHIGLSECSSDSLRRAHAVHPITAVQVEYSPWALEIEQSEIDLLKTARELGVATVSYSPIGRGFLSGRYRSPDDFEEGDFRKTNPRFSAENFPKNLKLVDAISQIAAKKGVTPAQLTLAWLLAQGDDIFPIPGTTNVDRLKENIAAAKITLTSEEKAEIRKISESAQTSGARYPEAFAAYCYSDTPPLQ